MGWTDAEYAQVVAMRGREPPASYSDIGRTMGRSGEAVRQKLISERVAAAAAGTRSRTAWRDLVATGPCLGERVFLRRLLAGGGHSRFSEVARGIGTQGHYWALVKPLIGPDGLARPCSRGDCQCVATQPAPAKGRVKAGGKGRAANICPHRAAEARP